MVVTGNIQILKKVAADDPKAARAAQAIELATQRGAALTRQLLTFSRRQRVNPQAIDMHQRIDSIRDVLTSGLGGHVRLTTDLAPDVWPVTVDPGEFEIALVNLVVNARDAMPDGGAVTITAENVSLQEGDVMGDVAGDFVAVSVADTGVGIPSDIISNVFDPFFTTKPVGKGTGLGLSQVHGFAHQAGGTVKIASTLGKGTTVTLYLPRGTAGSDSVEINETDAQQARTGTVLLVEDNPDVAGACAGLLEQLGYSVRSVPNAEAALQEIEKNGFDVVFSDIVMPGKLDGLGLARIIKEKHPGLPILLATGYSEAAHAVRLGVQILRKPYQMHELSRALGDLKRG
jgi:CheY-like chemotaxis protein